MPDSQSSEPGFESPFATVWKIGHWRPCSLSCINEYLAIDSGGNMSDLVFARNCCMARMLPGEAELVSEWKGLPGMAKSVQRFERSNGLDTAQYKNYLYLYHVEAFGCKIAHKLLRASYNIQIVSNQFYLNWHINMLTSVEILLRL